MVLELHIWAQIDHMSHDKQYQQSVCTQQRLRSAWASASGNIKTQDGVDSDQSELMPRLI